jgi:exonuclease SbcD
LDEAVQGTAIEILRVKNNRVVEHALNRMTDAETLDELDITEVFERCLETNEIPREQRPALTNAYKEIILSLHETDPRAE